MFQMTRLARLLVGTMVGLSLLVGLSGLAGAAPLDTENLSYPVDVVVVNGCNGHPIEFSGTEHFVMRVMQDGSGTMHVGMTYNVENFTGVDLLTGERYVGVSTSTNQGSFTINPYTPQENTLEAQYLMVSQGGSPNNVAHVLLHYTFDANGRLTAHTFTVTSECRG